MDDQAADSARQPWPFAIAIPQRFSSNYKRYQQLGGQIDIAEDAKAYVGDGKLMDVERLMLFSLVFDQIAKEGIPGDFLELGVYKGDTAALLAQYSRRLNRKLWLLDTYEGFDQRDFNGMDAGRRAGDFGDTSLETVKQRIGENNATFIKGYFPDTAESLPTDASYALVHIDVDLYAPILNALTYFYPRMSPGGYLIVHDYTSLGWAGADRAVDDFFSDKPECVVAIPDSAGSAVVRRQRAGGNGSNWISKRQAMSINTWQEFGGGRNAYILQEGWSSAEEWGVWGVGGRHSLTFIYGTSQAKVMTIEIDAHAYIPPHCDNRSFGILINGNLAQNLLFTREENRCIRTISTRVAPSEVVTLSFIPSVVIVPLSVDPATTEARPLGIALHRVRLLIE